jgi:hypothetical protein
MKISYTLLTDGSSDRAFIPVLNWLIREMRAEADIQAQWADMFRLPIAPTSLAERIEKSVELYPCDLLFIHRDAEKEPLATRKVEITRALAEAQKRMTVPPAVCVIPVRMMEAWLLFDEPAIRHAARNPNSSEPLALPKLKSVESIPDPKQLLYECLRTASGLKGRRLSNFDEHSAVHLVVERIKSFAPLRHLAAFRALETELKTTLKNHF